MYVEGWWVKAGRRVMHGRLEVTGDLHHNEGMDQLQCHAEKCRANIRLTPGCVICDPDRSAVFFFAGVLSPLD